jgi:hypothetical protein
MKINIHSDSIIMEVPELKLTFKGHQTRQLLLLAGLVEGTSLPNILIKKQRVFDFLKLFLEEKLMFYSGPGWNPPPIAPINSPIIDVEVRMTVPKDGLFLNMFQSYLNG